MNIKRNAVWNMLEVISTTLTQFLIFKIIIVHLNLAALGIWSLVFSALAFARVADVGAAASLVRFIARPIEETQHHIKPLLYVTTALVTNCILYSVLVVIIFYPIYYLLPLALNGSDLPLAQRLLPYAIVSFVILNISSVISSALTGYSRSDIKSKLVIVALLIQLFVSFFAIQKYGIVGLAIAQVLQNIFVVFVGWFCVLKVDDECGYFVFPFRFDFPAFKEIMSFGLKLQATNIVAFICDPLIKFVLSSVAGTAAVGLFETSSRLVLQARSVIMSPLQNFISMFAAIERKSADRTRDLYQKAAAIYILAAVSLLVMVVAVSPVASLLLFGHILPDYALWTAIFSVAQFFNIAAGPSYVMALGLGRLRWNFVGTATITFVIPTLGYVLGIAFGGTGFVVAYALGVGVGSMTYMYMNCRENHIRSVLPPVAIFKLVIRDGLIIVKEKIPRQILNMLPRG